MISVPVPNVAKGTLIIGGGGFMPDEVWQRFLDRAGGAKARILYIPTALDDPLKSKGEELGRHKKLGAENIKVLHAKSRAEANAPDFLAEIKEAAGVWFSGGRQWRFVAPHPG